MSAVEAVWAWLDDDPARDIAITLSLTLYAGVAIGGWAAHRAYRAEQAVAAARTAADDTYWRALLTAVDAARPDAELDYLADDAIEWHEAHWADS